MVDMPLGVAVQAFHGAIALLSSDRLAVVRLLVDFTMHSQAKTS